MNVLKRIYTYYYNQKDFESGFLFIILFMFTFTLSLVFAVMYQSNSGAIGTEARIQFLLNISLIAVTIVYVGLTYIIASVSAKQTDSILNQTKIADVEKILEKIYNPLYEILRKHISEDEPVNTIKDAEEVTTARDIFQNYSYLITNKKIFKEWDEFNVSNSELAKRVRTIRKGEVVISNDFLKIISQERKKLIKKRRNLIEKGNDSV